MGTHPGSSPAAHADRQGSGTNTGRRGGADVEAEAGSHVALDADLVVDRGSVVRARQQVFGFTLMGVLCCLAALVFSGWSPQHDPGRWFWTIIGSLAGVVCLVKAQRVHGGVGADRDASPYYGIFAGVISGALLLLVLSVDGWVLPSVFFVLATVLAFMAWIEQSAIGMTAAITVAVLCAGSGVAALDDAAAAGAGSLALGLMLLAGALAIGMVEDPVA